MLFRSVHRRAPDHQADRHLVSGLARQRQRAAIQHVDGGRIAQQRFFAINALLLRNASIINMLDGCALSLPCQAADQMPVGLMVWGPAMHDDSVLGVSLTIESALAAAAAAAAAGSGLSATGRST